MIPLDDPLHSSPQGVVIKTVTLPILWACQLLSMRPVRATPGFASRANAHTLPSLCPVHNMPAEQSCQSMHNRKAKMLCSMQSAALRQFQVHLSIQLSQHLTAFSDCATHSLLTASSIKHTTVSHSISYAAPLQPENSVGTAVVTERARLLR